MRGAQTSVCGATGPVKSFLRKVLAPLKAFWIRSVRTRLRLARNKSKINRSLEIGPGARRIPGLETLNISPWPDVDYVLDASKPLPFDDDTFELIYASHILEHIAWYKVQDTFREWVRILKPRGRLQIWVPDGLKICKALVDYELHGENYIHKDGWCRYNPERDPYKWAAGRLYTYGDGTGDPNHPNWHHSIFTPKYLTSLLEEAGLSHIRSLGPEDVREEDHGWISLGLEGTKP